MPESGTEIRGTLFHHVVQRLGRAIVRGDFSQPTLPVETTLSAFLGVGRNLLREAMKVLESKNIVSVSPKIGTRIRPRAEWHIFDADLLDWLVDSGDEDVAFDLIEFRMIIEPRAAHLAALRATQVERRAILIAFQAMEQCLAHPELFWDRDIAFHRAIYAASHNLLLENFGAHLGSLVGQQASQQGSGRVLQSEAARSNIDLHRQVAQAIVEADAAWAEDAARRLVLTSYVSLSEARQISVEGRLDGVVPTAEGRKTPSRRWGKLGGS